MGTTGRWHWKQRKRFDGTCAACEDGLGHDTSVENAQPLTSLRNILTHRNLRCLPSAYAAPLPQLRSTDIKRESSIQSCRRSVRGGDGAARQARSCRAVRAIRLTTTSAQVPKFLGSDSPWRKASAQPDRAATASIRAVGSALSTGTCCRSDDARQIEQVFGTGDAWTSCSRHRSTARRKVEQPSHQPSLRRLGDRHRVRRRHAFRRCSPSNRSQPRIRILHVRRRVSFELSAPFQCRSLCPASDHATDRCTLIAPMPTTRATSATSSSDSCTFLWTSPLRLRAPSPCPKNHRGAVHCRTHRAVA